MFSKPWYLIMAGRVDNSPIYRVKDRMVRTQRQGLTIKGPTSALSSSPAQLLLSPPPKNTSPQPKLLPSRMLRTSEIPSSLISTLQPPQRNRISIGQGRLSRATLLAEIHQTSIRSTHERVRPALGLNSIYVGIVLSYRAVL